MYLDPLDSPRLLRKISDDVVIDGFGNHYVLVPKGPQHGSGGFLVIIIVTVIVLIVLL